MPLQMARLYLNSNLQTVPTEELPSALQIIFNQLEDQVNEGPSLISLSKAGQAFPQGMARGDVVFTNADGLIRFGMFDGEKVATVQIGQMPGSISSLQHGNLGGGNLHNLATSTIAGFMSNADKAKSDTFLGFITAANPPSIVELPTSGQWAFFLNTTGPTFSLSFNLAGSIKSVILA